MAGSYLGGATVLPGDYMVTPTGSWVGSVIRALTHSDVNHAAVAVGDGNIVEGWTAGARLRPATDYPDAIWSHMPLTDVQRTAICLYAKACIGRPYNFLDIAAQAIVRVFHWTAPAWALERLSRPDRLQCAQLVDLVYDEAGVHLFPDGRPFGLVAPSDLKDLIDAAA